MASVFKPAGKSKYVIVYTDENGRRCKKVACTDKSVSERIAHELENQVALRREGLVDPQAEAYRDHAARPLLDHIAAWTTHLAARGLSAKHVEQTANRVKRLAAAILGADVRALDHRRLPAQDRGDAIQRVEAIIAPAHLAQLTPEKVQAALKRFRAAGWSLGTCNHYIVAIKMFSKWCYDTYRTREPLRGVKSYNAQEDRRHDRRTLALDELRRLIDAARRGAPYRGMTGAARALCYRLAVATGLRFSEIASIRPESFDWDAPSVTVAAAYTKNGERATQPLPDDLAGDLAAYVAPLDPGTPIFPLPGDRGATMLRVDLKAAGIPYRDAAGGVFDFHALRCETATLADAAGVTPRVVQRLMRHSSLELTGRYTRPRAVDVEAAAKRLPSLKPEGAQPESLAATGTDPAPVAPSGATLAGADRCKSPGGQEVTSEDSRSRYP
jgi:integrase